MKTQLKIWKKETKTIDVYLQGITTRLDQLAILRKPVDHEDQIDLILEGLTEDYKHVVDQAEGRDVPPSITELHERLLNHEAKLLNSGEALLPNGPVTVNVVQQRNNHTSNRNFNKQKNNYQGSQQSTTQQWNNSQQTNRYDNKGQRPYLGRCQICGVQVHSAKRCPQLQNFQVGTQQQQMTPFTPWNPRANYTVANPYKAHRWLMDSGATHHITSDLDALSLHQPYRGHNDVMVADGSTVPIHQTGFKSLSTLSRPLALQNVLIVPNIHKNPISVYRLCNANRVSVEFFPQSFQLKDLTMGDQLQSGKAKNELYEWPMKVPQANATTTYPSSKTTLSS